MLTGARRGQSFRADVRRVVSSELVASLCLSDCLLPVGVDPRSWILGWPIRRGRSAGRGLGCPTEPPEGGAGEPLLRGERRRG
jgi:hypothetical protein